jgi:hypothetical protein
MRKLVIGAISRKGNVVAKVIRKHFDPDDDPACAPGP